MVAERLGHADPSITMDLYGHLYADEMDTWAARLDETARRFEVWPECGQLGSGGVVAGERRTREPVTWGFRCALGGIRTPNLLIRRETQDHSPGRYLRQRQHGSHHWTPPASCVHSISHHDPHHDRLACVDVLGRVERLALERMIDALST
jgi:hypothetical protein